MKLVWALEMSEFWDVRAIVLVLAIINGFLKTECNFELISMEEIPEGSERKLIGLSEYGNGIRFCMEGWR
jgi:hypothetical protein